MFNVNLVKSAEVKVCDIDPEVIEKGKAFRLRKNQALKTAAIVRKCKWTSRIHIVQVSLDFSLTQYV